MSDHDVAEFVARLAEIRAPTIEECERALRCRFRQAGRDPRRHWAIDAPRPIESIDVRFGERGGVVVVNLEPRPGPVSLEGVVTPGGPPPTLHVVSPPTAHEMGDAAGPEWTRKWSEGHTIDGVEVSLGYEERGGETLLFYLARSF